MLFTLEALNAKHGDALILHYGEVDRPRTIVIDGGPSGVYKATLAPRLEQLRASRAGEEEPLEIDMLMVSHIDDDHVNGVIDLMEDLSEKVEDEQPVPYRIATLWHNSFDDIVDPQAAEELKKLPGRVPAGATPEGGAGPASVAVAASVDQGRVLRRLAARLTVRLNSPFDGLVSSADGPGPTVSLKEGLKFTIVGPSAGRLNKLNEEWDEILRKRAAKAKLGAEDAAYLDQSAFNLASIVVIAEAGGKTMLLTGDARGDDILEGLKAEGLLKRGKAHFDFLKLPHHGSERNVETDFFRRVTADHYLISADGRHGNPEVATLEMISEARDTDDFTVHLTNSEPRLVEFFEAEKGRGRTYRTVFREPQSPSMLIELGSESLAD